VLCPQVAAYLIQTIHCGLERRQAMGSYAPRASSVGNSMPERAEGAMSASVLLDLATDPTSPSGAKR
jgi:hypothetical protein